MSSHLAISGGGEAGQEVRAEVELAVPNRGEGLGHGCQVAGHPDNRGLMTDIRYRILTAHGKSISTALQARYSVRRY